MNLKAYIEKQNFQYDGPFSNQGGILGINCKFRIIPKGRIKLFWLGEENEYLNIGVEIFEMTPFSAYLFGEYLKNVEGRLVIGERFFYLSKELESIVDDFLETIGLPYCSISSINYIGEIPKTLEFKK